jgi:hypothetical protein
MFMKTKYILKGVIATLLFAFAISGCESFNEELMDGIGATREFSPLGVTAVIRTQTTVELNWTTKEDADHYVVEFSADDDTFKTIYKTVEVTAKQLPLKVQLEGETTYSIRVKAVSAAGLADSKWSVITTTTLSEQLFLASVDGDIDAKQVTLRWVANSNVTQIVVNPGAITHTITPAEKTSGIAVVTGLTGEKAYTADLFNGTKKRGNKAFTTAIDIGDGILVKTTDDLVQKIIDAPAGSVLVLEAGDYTAQIATIALAKSITIRGLRSFNKPKLKVNFSLLAGAANVSLIDLDLTGDVASAKNDVIKYNEAGTYSKLIVSGCTIHDYNGSFVSATSAAARIESITVDNALITNVGVGSTGEFIDLRGSFTAAINLTNSTFNNCAQARAFIREDVSAAFGTGLVTNTLIDSCTFYGVTNTIAQSGYQILYIRFATNATIVRNSLFAETVARYANQAATVAPTFTNNNYFNAATLNAAAPVSPLKSDASGTALNPQFTNAATGDFTLKNQTLIDNKIGDPRWRP